jgi:hypothetical protein
MFPRCPTEHKRNQVSIKKRLIVGLPPKRHPHIVCKINDKQVSIMAMLRSEVFVSYQRQFSIFFLSSK